MCFRTLFRGWSNQTASRVFIFYFMRSRLHAERERSCMHARARVEHKIKTTAPVCIRMVVVSWYSGATANYQSIRAAVFWNKTRLHVIKRQVGSVPLVLRDVIIANSTGTGWSSGVIYLLVGAERAEALKKLKKKREKKVITSRFTMRAFSFFFSLDHSHDVPPSTLR